MCCWLALISASGVRQSPEVDWLTVELNVNHLKGLWVKLLHTQLSAALSTHEVYETTVGP